MKSILLKLLIFPLVGTLSLLVFLVLTLPEDKIQLLVEKKLEAALDHQYRVQASEFSFSLLDGIEFKQVMLKPRFAFEDEFEMEDKLTRTNEDAEAELAEEGAPQSLEDQYFCPDSIEPAPFIIDRLHVDPSWMGLISNEIDAAFTIDTSGGSITGEIAPEDDGQHLQATIDDLALQRFTWLRNKLAVHMVGQFGGEVDLNFTKEFGLAGGTIDLNLKKVVVCPKKFKVNMPNVPFLELPLTRLGNLAGSIEIQAGPKIVFNDLQGEGEDVSIRVKGSVHLANPQMPKARYNIHIFINPDQDWVDRNGLDIVFRSCKRDSTGAIDFTISGVAGDVKKGCVKSQNPNTSDVRYSPTPQNTTTQEKTPTQRSAPKATPKKQSATPKTRTNTKTNSPKRFDKTKGGLSPAQGRRPPLRPASADELKGKVDPVPENRRRELLNVYDR